MNLKCVHVVGFFSLPSLSLAEANPSAYNAAMQAAPVGAGTCAHCGTGIRHHVIVEDAAQVRSFIGGDCATRLGSDEVVRCVSERKTLVELAVLDAEREELNARHRSAEAQRLVDEVRLGAKFADLADRLQGGRGSFCDDVAAGLRRGIVPVGRGLDITLDILAKQSGRRGSKGYNNALNLLSDRLASFTQQSSTP